VCVCVCVLMLSSIQRDKEEAARKRETLMLEEELLRILRLCDEGRDMCEELKQKMNFAIYLKPVEQSTGQIYFGHTQVQYRFNSFFN